MFKRSRFVFLAFVLCAVIISGWRIYAAYLDCALLQPKIYSYKNSLAPTDTGVIILSYHLVLDDNVVTENATKMTDNVQLKNFAVTKKQLADQLQTMAKNHVKVYSVPQLIALHKQHKVPKKGVVLTFDDIDYTAYTNAYPVLKKAGVPATFFIITGKTGQNLAGTRLATWAQIQKLNQDPKMTMGLHTNKMHYYQANGKPILASKTLSHQAIMADFQKSQQQFVKKLGQRGDYFAYPYGEQNAFLTRYMTQQGIEGIFTLETGLVNNTTSLQHLPRYIVNQDSWPVIKKWLTHK